MKLSRSPKVFATLVCVCLPLVLLVGTGGTALRGQPNAGSAAPCAQASLDDASFQQLVQQLETRSFHSARLSLVQAWLPSACWRSGQVAALLAQFPFDATRVQLAEQAYPYVLDSEAYGVVFQQLQHSSSRARLRAFIQRQRAPVPTRPPAVAEHQQSF